jgi:hypothetical protein
MLALVYIGAVICPDDVLARAEVGVGAGNVAVALDWESILAENARGAVEHPARR